MKRIIAAVVIVLGVSMAASGQQTEQQTSAQQTEQTTTRVITGAVIDKNGNPLPGAIVSATGGAETVTADADGSFTIEVPVWLKSLTASYPGLGEKRMKTTAVNQMIFTLKSRNRTHGFINLVGQMRTAVGSDYKIPMQGEFGVMGGAYRSWGGYLKVVIRCVGAAVQLAEKEEHYLPNPTVTFGVVKRITPNFNVLFGGGLGFHYGADGDGTLDVYDPITQTTTTISTDKPEYECQTQTGALEVGGMWKFCKKLNTTFGMSYIFPATNSHNSGNLGFFLGVGLNL